MSKLHMTCYKVMSGIKKKNEMGSIWKLKVPQRIRMFKWLVTKKAIVTYERRTQRHITNNLNFQLCVDVTES